MGNGHGGKRLGSGRKPHTRRERWLGGKAGHRSLTLVTPEPIAGGEVASEPAGAIPGDLKVAESAYWQKWAPLARARGMLHVGTVPGFVLLCQWAALADDLIECVRTRGYEQEKVTIDGAGQEHREYKANSLLAQWRGLSARVEQGMARYGLTADGKIPAGEGAGDSEDVELAHLLAVK